MLSKDSRFVNRSVESELNIDSVEKIRSLLSQKPVKAHMALNAPVGTPIDTDSSGWKSVFGKGSSRQLLNKADYSRILHDFLSSEDCYNSILHFTDDYEGDFSELKSVLRFSECNNTVESVRALKRAENGLSDSSMALLYKNSCNNPVCPICTAVRSHKLRSRVLEDVSLIKSSAIESRCELPDSVYSVLTLRNCSPSALPYTILVMRVALERLFGCSKSSVLPLGGTIKCEDSVVADFLLHDCILTYECTINTDSSDSNEDFKNPWFGTFHPHINILSLVPDSFFARQRPAVSKDKLMAVWCRCVEYACNRLKKYREKYAGTDKQLTFPATWYRCLIAFERLHPDLVIKSPVDDLDYFDSRRYLVYDSSGVPSCQVSSRKTRSKKGMDSFTAGVFEVCKYMCKLDDIQDLSNTFPDDLVCYMLLGYCVFSYNLRRVKLTGVFLDADKRLKQAVDDGTLPDDDLIVDTSPDALVLGMRGLYAPSDGKHKAVAGYVKSGCLSEDKALEYYKRLSSLGDNSDKVLTVKQLRRFRTITSGERAPRKDGSKRFKVKAFPD